MLLVTFPVQLKFPPQRCKNHLARVSVSLSFAFDKVIGFIIGCETKLPPPSSSMAQQPQGPAAACTLLQIIRLTSTAPPDARRKDGHE